MRAPEPPESVVRLILATPLYRGAVLAQFLSGIGIAAAAPQIATFLVDELGASLTTAGLYYLTSLTAPIVGFVLGTVSDRTGSRLGLFRLAAVLGSLGWLGISAATVWWVPFLLSALLLGFAGAASAQLFAAVHDKLAEQGGPVDDVTALVRMALTAGWVVGPTMGALLASYVGLRATFVATAVCILAQIVPMGLMRVTRRSVTTGVPLGRIPFRSMLPLLGFIGLFILVYAGEPARYAYLPIHMRENLHASPAVIGAVIGLQPLMQLPLMAFIVRIGRRVGWFRALGVGAACGMTAYLLFALSPTVVGLFIGQALMGVMWATYATIGLILAQRLLPTAVATASGMFLSATPLAQAVGGFVVGTTAGVVGLPMAFFAPVLMCLFGGIGLVLMGRRYPSL